MTRTEIYEIMDNTIESFFPCFSRESTRKWVKMFYERRYEVFSTRYWIVLDDERVTLYELKERDEALWTKYYNRWMTRGVKLTMDYIEVLKSRPDPRAKKEEPAKTVKRKKK